MRFLMVLIVAAAGLTPTSCADPVDDTPLRGSQGGLSVVRWGDGPEVVQRRILEMPDVSLIRDTLEIHAFAAWMTPDTVEAPESIPYYRIMEFRGGKFLGYPVERWIVTYDDATSFRQVQVCLASMQEAVEAQWKIRRQLRQLYRRPNDPDLEPNRFFADDWATPASSASTARTSVGIDIYGPEIRGVRRS